MQLAKSTWPEVDQYLKKSKSLLFPIGSTEQHGPTGLLGTDFLTAQAVADAVAERLQLCVAPALPYGMASHHMSFAGSVTLKPSVYQALLFEVFTSFYHHGFRDFYIVNGHGGNEFSVRSMIQELKHMGQFSDSSFHFFNWWKLPEVAQLASELYGDKEGFHATPSEVSLTFHLCSLEPRKYESIKSVEAGLTAKRRSRLLKTWPLTADEVRAVFPDGAMRSDPGLACAEHGRRFLEAACNSIAASIEQFEADSL